MTPMTPPAFLVPALLIVLGVALVSAHPEAVARAICSLCLFLGELCTQLAAACRTVVERSARTSLRALHPFPPAEANDDVGWGTDAREPDAATRPDDVWPGLIIVARLIAFSVAAAVVLGDLSLGRPRGAAVLLGEPASGPSPLPLDMAASALLLGTAALWSGMLLELRNLVPPEVQLFPHLGRSTRRVLTVVALGGFALSIASTGLIFLAGDLILEGYRWPLALRLINLWQGLLVPAITGAALWGIILGVTAAFALVAAALALAAAILARVLQIAARLLERLGEDVQPNLVYLVAVTGRGVVRACAWLLPHARDHDAGPPPVPLPPLHLLPPAAVPAADPDPYASAPMVPAALSPARLPSLAHTYQEEDAMTTVPFSHRTTSLAGLGPAGRRLVPELRAHLDHLRAGASLAAQAVCDITRIAEAPLAPVTRDGVIDTSATRADLEDALAAASGPEQVEEHLAHALVDKLVQANLPSRLGHGQILWIQDLRDIARSLPALRELHARLPRHVVAVIAYLPDPDQWDDLLEVGARHLMALREDGVIATTLLVDPCSPLARRVGGEGQDRIVASALAAHLVAPLHDQRAPAFAEVLARLGVRSPFAGLASGSASVAAGEEVRWWEPVRRSVNGPVRGIGDVVDARNQTKLLARQVLAADSGARTVAAPLDPSSRPLFVVVKAPIRPGERRWLDFTGGMRPWWSAEYEGAVVGFVHGNGTPLGQAVMGMAGTAGAVGAARSRSGRGDPYFVQVSCLYGVGPLAWARGELEGKAPASARPRMGVR